VIAVDGSPAMIEQARAALPEGQVTTIVSDLLELELSEPADAAFSTAVFHWIKDHRLLFSRLHAALRPGARLVAQCGGQGNIAGFMAKVEALLADESFTGAAEGWERPWWFSPPATAALALSDAGFTDVDCWLEPSPVVLDEPHEFLRTVVLAPHIDRLGPELGEELVERAVERAGTPLVLDYVRLNINATRGDA
jgi:trans-aconitate 2-methyltransferase